MGHAEINASYELGVPLSNSQQAGMFSSNLVGGRRRLTRGKFKKIYKSYTKRGPYAQKRTRIIKQKAKTMNMKLLTKMMNKIKSLRRKGLSRKNKTLKRKYHGGMNSITMSGNPLASASIDSYGKLTSCLPTV